MPSPIAPPLYSTCPINTEASTTQSTTPETPPSLDDISARLHQWMHQGGPSEKRVEAKNRILNAIQHKATELRLNCLGLTDLPAEIGLLHTLQALCVWDNKLTTLPTTIGQLTRLTKLNLGRNQLTSLPTEIESLGNLQELNLRSNPLLLSPNNLQQLGKLNALHTTHTQVIAAQPTTHLEGFVSLPHLPQHLANHPECQQFFNAFSQQLNSHYFALQTLTSASLLEPEHTWTQTIFSALQLFSVLGSVVTGEVVHSLAQQRAHKEACDQALVILNLFPTPLHFTITIRHAGVLFTQRLAQALIEPNRPTNHSATTPTGNYTRQLTRAYSTLQIKAGLQIQDPWEKISKAREMSTLFLKNLTENPLVQELAANNTLNLGDYSKHLAELVVNDVLGSQASSSHTIQPTTPPTLQERIEHAVANALKPIEARMQQLAIEVEQLKQENEELKKKPT